MPTNLNIDENREVLLRLSWMVWHRSITIYMPSMPTNSNINENCDSPGWSGTALWPSIYDAFIVNQTALRAAPHPWSFFPCLLASTSISTNRLWQLFAGGRSSKKNLTSCWGLAEVHMTTFSLFFGGKCHILSFSLYRTFGTFHKKNNTSSHSHHWACIVLKLSAHGQISDRGVQ